MRYLIDTHALLWWWLDDPRLTRQVRDALRDRGNEVHVSSASGWEIATNVRLGKMPQMAGQVRNYGALVTDDGFLHLAIRHDHGVTAGSLPGEHRDPFDRMIAAQGLIEGLAIVTRDPAFAALGCKVLW